jgi:Clp protease
MPEMWEQEGLGYARSHLRGDIKKELRAHWIASRTLCGRRSRSCLARDLCPPHRPGLRHIEKTLDRDYFLSAEDALTFGIVDEVITKRHPLDEQIQKLMPVS